MCLILLITLKIPYLLVMLLPFDFKNYEILSKLPFHHQDPFDRMLIAQAISENIPIISHDSKFDLYDVVIIDAIK